MSLTDKYIDEYYKDLVQVEKGGLGLPSHAGKEAALYDGSGAQILGRTAQRHWLDPHPDAAGFDETWEFSTYGDANQAALEGATPAWTFTNLSGDVSEGVLWLSNISSTTWAKASIPVSLSGDFDIMIMPIFGQSYGDVTPTSYQIAGGGVARTGTDVVHHVYSGIVNGNPRVDKYVTGTWANGAGTNVHSNTYSTPMVLRILRVSGIVYLMGGGAMSITYQEDETSGNTNGWSTISSVADANTFDKLFLAMQEDTTSINSAKRVGFHFLRRFQ